MQKKIILFQTSIKKNYFKENSLLCAVEKNNIEIVQLLIEYAKENNIIFEVNEENNHGYNPLLWAMQNNDIKMVKPLMNYAKNIFLYHNNNEFY